MQPGNHSLQRYRIPTQSSACTAGEQCRRRATEPARLLELILKLAAFTLARSGHHGSYVNNIAAFGLDGVTLVIKLDKGVRVSRPVRLAMFVA